MKNSIKKDVRAFSEMERELGLFERKYNGTEYWDAIRFSACEAAFTSRYAVTNSIVGKKRSLFSIIRIFFISLKSVLEYGFIGKKDILMFSMSRLHSRFFDYLEMPDGAKGVLCKTWWNDTRLDDGYVIPEAYLKILSKCKFGRVGVDLSEKEFLKKVEKEIETRFGQTLSVTQLEKNVLSYLSDRKARVPFFEHLIKRTGCKLIVLTCYYSNTYYYLIEAAHNCGIKVLELQHGVINNHIAYYYADRKRVYKHVPDYLLTFGEEHSKWVSLPESEQIICTGNPYQEKMLTCFSDIKTDDKLVIVYPKLSEDFEKMICEFADSITKKGYKVLIKMHPGEAKQYNQYYPILSENTNVEIVTRQNESIYYWLKLAKHHVMASSTVGMEAVMYDHTCIYIAENVEHEQVKPLLEWRGAMGFSSSEELEQLVTHPVSLDKSECCRKLWKEDAVNNVKKCMERVMAE